MIRLGTNILSQKVQRNLSRVTEDLSKTSERLASGMRINRASDDAAGLAISTSLNANARVYSQGVRNLNDGISVVSIAEGALNELGTIVLRIQELATQSMNGTLSDTQRASLQKEVGALQDEWNRVVESTTFNGRTLLTGTSTESSLQGGKGTSGTLNIRIGEASLGLTTDPTRAGLTARTDTGSNGNTPNGTSNAVFLSADGRYVAFNSTATNITSGDTNGAQDVFIKDTVTGETRLVSSSSSGAQGNDLSHVGGISGDGRYVTFWSYANNLVAGDTNGVTDSFIKDMATGVVTRISTDSSGTQGNDNSFATAISSDGRYVGFYSYATNLASGDTNGVQDAFIKDTFTGKTTRVSTDSSGNQGNNYSEINSISADGRYVGFDSAASNLVAGDSNGVTDAFIKDIVTGITTRVSTTSAGAQANGYSEMTAM